MVKIERNKTNVNISVFKKDNIDEILEITIFKQDIIGYKKGDIRAYIGTYYNSAIVDLDKESLREFATNILKELDDDNRRTDENNK